MTDFGNLMRTDQQIAQNRQFYDAQRYQSDRFAADTLARIPGQVQGAMMNNQSMVLNELDMELKQQQVESDLRLQEATIESQFHQQKISQMLALDEVDASRERVRALQFNRKVAEYDFEQRKKKEGQGERSALYDLFSKMGSEEYEAAASGDFVFDFEQFQWVQDPERASKYREMRSKKTDRDPLLEANSLRYLMDKLAQPYTDANDGRIYWEDGDPKSDRAKAEYERMQRMMLGEVDRWAGNKGYPIAGSGSGSGAGARPSGPVGPPPTGAGFAPGGAAGSEIGAAAPPTQQRSAATEMSPMAQQQFGYAAHYAQSNPGVRQMMGSMNEKQGQRFLAGVAKAAEVVVNNPEGPWGKVDPSQASRFVLDAVQRNGELGAFFMTVSGYDSEQIRTRLATRHSPEQVEAIMKQRANWLKDIEDREARRAQRDKK